MRPTWPRVRVLAGLGALLAWLVAAQSCAPAPTPGIPGVPVAMPDAASLETYLEHAGVSYEYVGEADVAWFEEKGRFYDLPVGPDSRPEVLFVHTYADEAAAREEFARMAPDAKRIVLRDDTNMQIEWLGSPHVFLSGPMIIVYVGTSPAITEALEAGLGPQAAGVGPAIPVPIKGES